MTQNAFEIEGFPLCPTHTHDNFLTPKAVHDPYQAKLTYGKVRFQTTKQGNIGTPWLCLKQGGTPCLRHYCCSNYFLLILLTWSPLCLLLTTSKHQVATAKTQPNREQWTYPSHCSLRWRPFGLPSQAKRLATTNTQTNQEQRRHPASSLFAGSSNTEVRIRVPLFL